MKNVTIDFDGTLQRPDVQEFVKALMLRPDVAVYVLTARFDELHKQKWIDSPTNQNLYAVTDKLGISRDKIRFQNFRPKYEYLHGANVAVHLDDCDVEIEGINLNTNVPCVDVKNELWEAKMMEQIDKPLSIQVPAVSGEIIL